MKPQEDFGDYLERVLGTRMWVVSPRLTPRLKDKGYDVALSQARYRDLNRRWEVETYGGPLLQMERQAPALVRVLRQLLGTAELGQEGLEEETLLAIEEAEGVLRDAGVKP